jgi:glutamine amidotransferase-like uncharacterized protein
MLCKKVMAVQFVKDEKLINGTWSQTAKLSIIKSGGIYSYHSALED